MQIIRYRIRVCPAFVKVEAPVPPSPACSELDRFSRYHTRLWPVFAKNHCGNAPASENHTVQKNVNHGSMDRRSLGAHWNRGAWVAAQMKLPYVLM